METLLRCRLPKETWLAKLAIDKGNNHSHLQLAESYELLATKEEQLGQDILKPPGADTR
jgi:hypothetical protein